MSSMVEWQINKIKGGFAEAVCRSHFEAMGYRVEQVGIEHIAPYYARHVGDGLDHYARQVQQHLQKLPDFLVSRKHNGKLQAFFVETKFRGGDLNAQQEQANLLWTYRHLIWSDHFLARVQDLTSNEAAAIFNRLPEEERKAAQHSAIIFYLVTPRPVLLDGAASYVHCNYTSWPKWWWAGCADFDRLPLYQASNQNYLSFNQAYEKIVRPALEDLLQE